MQFHFRPAILRISALAAALIAAAALLPSAGVADEGEAAFKARCGQCHGLRDIQFWGRQRPDAVARQAWLERFLRGHYPPPAAERDLIIGYIQKMIGQATPR